MLRSLSLLACASILACGTSPPGLDTLVSTETSESSGSPSSSGTTLDATSSTSGSTTNEQSESTSGTATDGSTNSGDESSSETGDDPSSLCGEAQSGECDTHIQNCAEGLKCVPWDVDDDRYYDETRCVTAQGNSVGAYESCRVHEGMDDCVPGTFCQDIDWSNSTGTCLPLCGCAEGSNVATCDDAEMACVAWHGVAAPLCRPRCDPLLQNCGDGSGCYWAGDDVFVCIRSFGGIQGGECGESSYCAAGLECLPGMASGCVSGTCCMPYCDLSAGSACPTGSQCRSLWDEGSAPPGLEDVGLCRL